LAVRNQEDQPRQDSISINKLVVMPVVPVKESIGRRMVVPDPPQAKGTGPYLKKKSLKQKGLGT
jgi:hypothetical protein